MLAFTAPSPTAAAIRAGALPDPFGTSVLKSLSQLDGHLPCLLDNLEAAFPDNGGNDTFISAPSALGVLNDRTAFPVSMTQLLARGIFFGWGGPPRSGATTPPAPAAPPPLDPPLPR